MADYRVLVISKKGHAMVRKIKGPDDTTVVTESFGRLVSDMESRIKGFWTQTKSVVLQGEGRKIIAKKNEQGWVDVTEGG